jgi:hypothetical protein
VRNLLLAGLLLGSSGECPDPEQPVPSVNPLVVADSSVCLPDLEGIWVRDTLPLEPVALTIWREDSEVCALSMGVVDTAMARLIGDVAFLAAVEGDSIARAHLVTGPRSRAGFQRDSLRLLDAMESLVVATAHAGELEGRLFLDIGAGGFGGPFHGPLIYTHWFWSVSQDSLGNLILAPFSRNWVAAALDSNRIQTPHLKNEHGRVLIGPTPELQRLVALAIGDSLAFPESGSRRFRKIGRVRLCPD